MYQSNFYNSPVMPYLPEQMVSKSEKDEKWGKENLDAFEAVGRQQFYQNVRLIENYEMVKGKFVPTHYFDQPEYKDMIDSLHQDFTLPSYLRHYDITSQIINTMSGEWQQRPDTFIVKDESEHASNAYTRQQTDLLSKYVMTKIQAEVAKKMIEAGIGENGAANLPPEQLQQYQQQVEQARQQMTPPEVQQYMQTDWCTASEMWGQHQRQLDRKRFKEDEMEKRELEDMLIADRCFRHFYLTPTGYKQETWNPVNVFFHKSPEVEYIEDGDYVGRIIYLTIPAIIDRYGHRMTKAQLEALKTEHKKTDKKWAYAAGTDYVYDDYMVPFQGYPAYEILRNTGQTQGIDGVPPWASTGLPQLDSASMSSMFTGKFYNEGRGIYMIVEAYWKSQEKIGKVNYTDPDTGMPAKMYVDEDVIIPKHFKQMDSAFMDDSDEMNTVVWTWVNRVWRGTKICVKNFGGLSEDIYLDVEPLEFQFKGDLNPYEAKLPVCGQVFSVRNSQSMSLVDFVKPHQIGYNVAMNQAYQEMQKDAGKFVVMDSAMFADMKDWGGSNAYDKFMTMAKELGVTVVNTRPSGDGSVGGASGHYPKEIDLDASSRILSRLKIAEAFEAFALKQVGFNEYRLGQQAGTTTATTTQQGEARSFAQTESYFTNFSNYLRRCHRMDLDIAQYTQVNNQDILVNYVKNDMSRSVVKIQGTDLLFSELNLYVWNSQEEVRQLNMLRQLAMSNNTLEASFTDLADVITSNSPAEIKLKLKEAQKRTDDMKMREYDLQRQQIQINQQLEEKKMEIQSEQFEEEWGKGGTRERIAYMTTFNRQPDNELDKDANGTPDLLEYDKLSQKASAEEAKTQVQSDKNALEREKMQQQREIELGKLMVQKQKIDADLQIQREELQSVKILKGQANTQKAKKPKK